MVSAGEWFLPTVVDLTSARRAALYSVGASVLMAALFMYFVVTGSNAYPNVVGLGYACAFVVAALGTWFLSRMAAVAALLVYFSLHHANDSPLKFGLHVLFYAAFFSGIRAAWLFQRLGRVSRS